MEKEDWMLFPTVPLFPLFMLLLKHILWSLETRFLAPLNTYVAYLWTSAITNSLLPTSGYFVSHPFEFWKCCKWKLKFSKWSFQGVDMWQDFYQKVESACFLWHFSPTFFSLQKSKKKSQRNGFERLGVVFLYVRRWVLVHKI